jgi:dihydrofolate synthase/folylpolyglutamate synthase
MAVVEARCRAVGVPILVEGRQLMVQALASDLDGHRLRLGGPDWAYDDVRLALPGLFQTGNAVLAVGAVRVFADATGLPVPEAAVRAGCAAVRWPGRFQVIPGAAGRPTLVLDGAHNPAGATALATSLRHHCRAALALVLGVRDKDRVGILKALAPLASRIYLAPADHPRATPPKELLDQLPPVEADVVLTTGSEEALERALGEPGIDVVCVAGSLFLVADALRWLGARGLVDAV